MLEARIIDNSQYNNLLIQNTALLSLYHTKTQAFQDKKKALKIYRLAEDSVHGRNYSFFTVCSDFFHTLLCRLNVHPFTLQA